MLVKSFKWSEDFLHSSSEGTVYIKYDYDSMESHVIMKLPVNKGRSGYG